MVWKKLYPFIYLGLFIAFSCSTTKTALDIQGHRGLRAYLPENSIPGFLKAVSIGVKTLEMDVVITKDQQVIVSHDPFLSSEICISASGATLTKGSETNFNIYNMNYAEVKSFDCGSMGNKNFPYQQKIAAYKPLLTQVIDSVERHVARKGLEPVTYNIEIKSSVAGDNFIHPNPLVYAELVVETLKEKKVWDHAIIQSFDVRPLKIIKEKYPEARLALLVDNKKTPAENIAALGFKPYIYSPNYKLVNAELMKFAHEKKMRVIPWTVNENADIEQMITFGVDGIISDYPNRVMKLTVAGKPKKKVKA